MHEAMRVPDLIQKKRDNHQLSSKEIRWFITELVQGRIEQVQLGAMLMAWFFNGMTSNELAVLVDAMAQSGDTLVWPEDWRPVLVDKHSTGGVGDKVSLVLAPALAACGMKVPMVSGRGLSFTGGTLDKLESIPGFNVHLNNDQMLQCLKEVGCFIAGQTSALVPADRIMYAARDVTATVDNINLATASIISKKAAENISALVLDVKVGRAAFFKELDTAKKVALSLVNAANDQGIKTTAMLTTMDTPIGLAIGNTLEVLESVQTLRGQGPSDLIELVKAQGGLLLQSVGITDAKTGEQMIEESLNNGTALERFHRMLILQGVDSLLACDLCSGVDGVLPESSYVTPLLAPMTGRVLDIDALACGIVSGTLGAARARASDAILPAVGIELLVASGQTVSQGQVWARVHHETSPIPDDLLEKLNRAIVIGSGDGSPHNSASRILGVIQ